MVFNVQFAVHCSAHFTVDRRKRLLHYTITTYSLFNKQYVLFVYNGTCLSKMDKRARGGGQTSSNPLTRFPEPAASFRTGSLPMTLFSLSLSLRSIPSKLISPLNHKTGGCRCRISERSGATSLSLLRFLNFKRKKRSDAGFGGITLHLGRKRERN